MNHFEAVQIEMEHRKQMRRLTPVLDQDTVQPVEKQRPIGQSRQRIVEGLEKQPLLGLALLLDQLFPFQRLRDRVPQPAESVFQQIIRCARLHTLHRHILAHATRHDNKREIQPPFFHQLQRVLGGELRHGEIGKDEIRRLIQFAKIGVSGIDPAEGRVKPCLPERFDHQLRIGRRVFK